MTAGAEADAALCCEHAGCDSDGGEHGPGGIVARGVGPPIDGKSEFAKCAEGNDRGLLGVSASYATVGRVEDDIAVVQLGRTLRVLGFFVFAQNAEAGIAIRYNRDLTAHRKGVHPES